MGIRRSTRRTVATLAAALLAVGALAVPAVANNGGGPATDHCPDHEGHDGKVEASSSGQTVVLDDGTEVTVAIDGREVTFTDAEGDLVEVEFCVKAAREATTGEGAQYATDGSHGGSALYTPNGRNHPDISYVVVYDVVDADEGDGGIVDPAFAVSAVCVIDEESGEDALEVVVEVDNEASTAAIEFDVVRNGETTTRTVEAESTLTVTATLLAGEQVEFVYEGETLFEDEFFEGFDGVFLGDFCGGGTDPT